MYGVGEGSREKAKKVARCTPAKILATPISLLSLQSSHSTRTSSVIPARPANLCRLKSVLMTHRFTANARLTGVSSAHTAKWHLKPCIAWSDCRASMAVHIDGCVLPTRCQKFRTHCSNFRRHCDGVWSTDSGFSTWFDNGLRLPENGTVHRLRDESVYLTISANNVCLQLAEVR
jgi:hypothetical protein